MKEATVVDSRQGLEVESQVPTSVRTPDWSTLVAQKGDTAPGTRERLVEHCQCSTPPTENGNTQGLESVYEVVRQLHSSKKLNSFTLSLHKTHHFHTICKRLELHSEPTVFLC